MNVQSISTLAEYLSWVEASRPKDDAGDYAMFYRGHSDANYKMEPTVYRSDAAGKTFRMVEHQLYEEMLRHSPSSFAEDRNLFERIVRMQHHGLPTRLLDLTQSPLVALYFACVDHASKGEVMGKDGEVIFLPRKRMDVLHSSDIPESALVGIEQSINLPSIVSLIAKMLIEHFEVNIQLKFKCSKMNAEFQSVMCKWICSMDALKDVTDLVDVVEKLNAMEEDIRTFVQTKHVEADALSMNKDDMNEKLAHANGSLMILEYCLRFNEQVSRIIARICEKLRFGSNVEFYSLAAFLVQFVQYYFVFPPINNARIRQQQGAFIVFPPGRTNKWPLEKIQSEVLRVKVNASAKDLLLNELSYMGITQGFIYADLNAIAVDVKLNYRGAIEIPVKGNIQ